MKRESRFSIWNKTIRKYLNVKRRIEEGLHGGRLARLNVKLNILERRIFRMHAQWPIRLTLAGLMACLTSPIIAQDTLRINSNARFTELDPIDLWNTNPSGTPTSLDFNGDGEQDILLSGGFPHRSYIIFGESGNNLLTTTNGNVLDGNNGFVIDNSSRPVILDINDDGKDDILSIEGSWGNPHVLFGTDNPMQDTVFLDSIDPTDGFEITSPNAWQVANKVVALEDFNGDGINDLALFDYYRYYYNQHSSFILFGSENGFDPVVNLEEMDPGDGLTLVAAGNYWAEGVASGDLNGDGATDLAIGLFDSNQIEVVFGNPDGFSNDTIQWNDAVGGTNGFTISGMAGWNGYFGLDLCVPGDLNNDGYDELLFSAGTDVSTAADSSSSVYGLYGSNSIPSSLSYADLHSGIGFKITLDAANTFISSAGDINGDNLPDFMLSPGHYHLNVGIVDSSTYIVYGSCTGYPDSSNASTLFQSTPGSIIPGIRYYASDNVGDYNNDGFKDVIFGTYLNTNNYILSSEQSILVDAGLDEIICNTCSYMLSGNVIGGGGTSTWTTSGSGWFDDATLPNATYTPSAGDIVLGSVTLTLSTDNSTGPCSQVTDEMTLSIDASMGIRNVDTKGGLLAFPNPSKEGVEISFGKQLSNVKVYSSIGELLQYHKQASGVSGFSAGAYMVVADEGTIKLIVQ